MTEEDRKILLADLCGRLPYNVKGRVFTETSNGDYDINGDMIFIDTPFVVVLDQVNIQTEEISVTAVGNEETVEFIDNEQDFGEPYHIEDFKPYLRPLSSMTDGEIKELYKIEPSAVVYDAPDTRTVRIVDDINQLGIGMDKMNNVIDFLNSRHFDWRGLIPKGIALEAPEGMYGIKG